MAPRYITGDELAKIIKNKDKVPKKDYLVVDVRDDDFVGGNIPNAINIPSYTFHDSVNDLVKQTKDVKLIVFHCALSQQRGPKAARIFHETVTNLIPHPQAVPEVVILRDGFSQFQVKFKDDPDLVENWDKDVWTSEWS